MRSVLQNDTEDRSGLSGEMMSQGKSFLLMMASQIKGHQMAESVYGEACVDKRL